MIILVGGVFDVIHVGHISLFEELAHRYPEYNIVVGVNGDRRTAEIKENVLFSATERAKIVGSIKWVSGVEIFDEDDPSELIRSVKPSIFVKGPEYKDVFLPEQAACDEVGCQIIFVGTKTNSSSELKRRLKGSNG